MSLIDDSHRTIFGYYLLEVELFTLENCQPYERSWLSAFLSLSRYTAQIITVLLFVVGIRYRELYLLLFGFGLLIDEGVNFTINILNPSMPRVPTCTPVYGSVIAYQVQHADFFVTFLLGYVALYRACAKLWHFALLVGFHAWVVLGAHFLNYHTAVAIVAGAALGSINALIYQAFLYWFVVPYFPVLTTLAPVRYFQYQDTLCTTPTLNGAQRQQRAQQLRAAKDGESDA